MKNIFKLLILTLLFSTSLNAAFIGDPAPGFSLKDINGNEKSLQSSSGRVVLVNFWASWCPPCKQEFPEINELANEYKAHNVDVLAINLDKSPERVNSFLEKIGVKTDALHILLDPDAKVVAQYVARSMPTSFVIDDKGIIRFVHFGYSEKDPAKWRSEIDTLLNTLPKPGKAAPKAETKRSLR